MNKNVHRFKYILVDLFSSLLVWVGFFIYRQSLIDNNLYANISSIFEESVFWYGFVLYPLFWNILYVSAGMYRRVYRKTRLIELEQTIVVSLIGIFILFFILLINDQALFGLKQSDLFFKALFVHFFLTYIGRLFITNQTIRKIHTKKIGFNTILIGTNGNAIKVFNDIENQEYSSGNRFIGFVHAKEHDKYKIAAVLPHLGSIEDLPRLIKEYAIEEVIIAIEKSETDLITSIITELELFDVVIKIIPLFHDYIVGNVKTTGIFQTPLIEISPDLMPDWQLSLKRLIDILLALIAILILSPIYLLTALIVKLTSAGPIFYTQKRIGKNGKEFLMIKFRSMYADAEKLGPQLSSKSDARITPFGAFIRKIRVDEIPQFFTVLKGEMSIVGPRPERQFYIDQILDRAPHFKLLQKVKPGMTSWGQVKFGYAENIDEMIERLQYDILYLENMSLAMDFKIMIWTALIVVQGRGK
ncbi:MAG: sugar transferase [Bacteroidales bacterium]|nr:sugar transferase [Bacteroidales bacterium]